MLRATARGLIRAHTPSPYVLRVRLHSTLATIGHHDLAGREDLLEMPIPQDEPLHSWELEAHALYACLAKKGCFSTDEIRRTIEAYDPAAYETWGYYEKFSAATALLLKEKGLLEPGELEREIYGDVAASPQGSPPFAPGDCVVVRREDVVRTTWRRPHLRTPGYLHGATGHVERFMGSFGDPSLLAYGMQDAPALPLYRVRFRLADLWSEAEEGERDTTVTVDVYGSWLAHPEDAAREAPLAGKDEAEGGVLVHPPGHHGGHYSHGHHDHGHEHGHDHGTRQQIERAAVEAEGPPGPGVAVHDALQRLAIAKGLVTAEMLRATAQTLETALARLPGAGLMARAWCDEGFKARLLADGNAAAAELGITASNPNAPTKLVVVENTEDTHNLVVCTLCSCYPAALMGPAPLWYKASSYRARAVRRPRRLLEDGFGLVLPAGVQVAVHDSTADLRFLVLPARPAGTEAWEEAELRALVTRDAMIGTAVCSVHVDEPVAGHRSPSASTR